MPQRKYLVLGLLLLAIALRWEHELFNPKFWSDEMAQYIAAKSVMEGHGTTLPFVMANDLSTPIYLPLKQFPEGYSYMIAPVWSLTGSLYFSVIFWQWLSILAYLFSFWLLYRLFETELNPSIRSAFLMITAFSLSPWLYYKPTDLISVSFFLLAVTLFVYGITVKKGAYALFAILSGAVLGVCMTLRYAYQPIMPLTTVAILVIGIWTKNKRIVFSSVLSLVTLAFVWGGFTLFLKMPGNLPSEAQTQKLYIENLLQGDLTIFTKPFFDDRLISTALGKMGLGSLAKSMQILVSLSFFGLSLWLLLSKKTIKLLFSNPPKMVLLGSTFMAAVSSVGLLYLLSALAKPQENDYLHVWTYVRELRYYALFFVFFLILALFLVYNRQQITNSINWTRMGLSVLLGISVLYYFLAKFDTIRSDPDYFTIGESKIMSGESKSPMLPLLKKIILENTINGTAPLYLAANRTVRYAQLSGARLLFPDYQVIANLQTSKPVAILIHLGKNDPYEKGILQTFVKRNQIQTLFQTETDTLYQFILRP